MAKFKAGDIIEWTGGIGRIMHIHCDVWGPKSYIIEWLNQEIVAELHEKWATEASIVHLENNAKLASENYQILYGNI